MFRVGELVVYGNNGVFQVETVGPLEIMQGKEAREYYTLRAVKEKKKKVYVPVDGKSSSLRRIITREETLELIERLPALEPLTVENEKFREQCYKEIMNIHSCEAWLRILKTLHKRSSDRRLLGKKATSLDARYLQLAQKCLEEEFSLSLGLSPEDLSDFLAQSAGEFGKKRSAL